MILGPRSARIPWPPSPPLRIQPFGLQVFERLSAGAAALHASQRLAVALRPFGPSARRPRPCPGRGHLLCAGGAGPVVPAAVAATAAGTRR
eukprot:2828825-Pyramimonas_sp.AAC.1